jgi:hypothetical protein
LGRGAEMSLLRSVIGDRMTDHKKNEDIKEEMGISYNKLHSLH